MPSGVMQFIPKEIHKKFSHDGGDKITPELIETWDRQYKNRREIHLIPVELD